MPKDYKITISEQMDIKCVQQIRFQESSHFCGSPPEKIEDTVKPRHSRSS